MIRSSEGTIPTLCIIDEILCGTNSAERLVASEEILKYLAGKNSRVVAATHDIELVDRLTPFYAMYYFSDDVDDKGLHFDFRIRPGKATTTNAIRLLDYLGYPKEIIENAQASAVAAKANGRHDLHQS
jgi:DNA mismatch repair ATPase MutS